MVPLYDKFVSSCSAVLIKKFLIVRAIFAKIAVKLKSSVGDRTRKPSVAIDVVNPLLRRMT